MTAIRRLWRTFFYICTHCNPHLPCAPLHILLSRYSPELHPSRIASSGPRIRVSWIRRLQRRRFLALASRPARLPFPIVLARRAYMAPSIHTPSLFPGVAFPSGIASLGSRIRVHWILRSQRCRFLALASRPARFPFPHRTG
jgi:hypothetical protein